MPTDGNFSFSVLIADLPVPEYTHEGKVYVESNLCTPVTYRQLVRETVYGEIEEQEWPVTPYRVKVEASPHCPQSWYELYVDGTKVGKRVMQGGETWVCKGFRDSDGDREFLFSLPRFPRDENDRVGAERKAKIGTIEVVRKSVTFLKQEYRASSKDTEFSSANKKDARAITGGKHTMATTKKGKIVKHRTPLEGGMMKNMWDVGPELGRLSVEYRMAHTLQDLDITVRQMDWSQNPTLSTEATPSTGTTASQSKPGRKRKAPSHSTATSVTVKIERKIRRV